MPEEPEAFTVSSAVLDSLLEEVVIIDANGRVLHVNAAWREFARRAGARESVVCEGSDYLGALRNAAVTDLDAARTVAGIESVLAGTADFFEHEYMCAVDGEERWFGQRVSPLRGRSRGAVIAHIDITDRKLAEQERESHRFELGRAVRAATLGQLSGALAHELNQPLAAILTNAQVALAMKNRLGPAGDLFEILEDIERDARRAGKIIDRLRRMLQGQTKKLELVNLNKVIEETLTLCKSELISRRIALVTRLGSNVPPLLGDPIALQHLLLNVIVNAYEAMTVPEISQRVLQIATCMPTEDRIRVSLTDSGPGIDHGAGTKLFEPLYTTKASGLGLGLSICRSIVAAHEGDITVSRAASGGALVDIELPVSPVSTVRPTSP